jgi:lipid-binding SYLF domain-containing protein
MLERLKKLGQKLFSALGKEEKVLKELHEETEATLDRLESRDPGLRQLLKNAHGYVVFPSVGKASAVLGAAFGKGEVFERGKMIGYAGLAQLTLGVQLGGDTFTEVIAFQDKAALDRFKAGRWAFAANASAVLIKAGAAASSNYERGAAVFVSAEGGMMLELAIGAQKFFYRPAVLGRARQIKDTLAKRSRKRPPGTGKRRSTSKRAPTHPKTAKRSPARSRAPRSGAPRKM